MTKEQSIGEQHRYMELRHMLEGLFRSMSHLKVEGEEHIANFNGPAILYSPHWCAVDFVGTGSAIDKFLKFTYKKQHNASTGALASWMAMYAGGIPVNDGRKFYQDVFEAFDENQIVFIYPEGDVSLGKPAVGKPLVDLVKITKAYERHNKRLSKKKMEVAIIPSGLEYILPPVKIPWPATTPIPCATRLIVRFGEPIYPSEHPDISMDDYMRIIAKLSNRPYAPDLAKKI